MQATPEPWLRGPVRGVNPLVAPVFYAFEQAREDLAAFTRGLTTEQIWLQPHHFGSVGFHLRHIAGSIDRLITYLQGEQLSEEQLSALSREAEPGASRELLLSEVDQATRRAERVIQALDPAILEEPREVGRKRLPTTVVGLLVHIAEHTQRHVGQAISASHWARVWRP
jgi:uncharacterized damage-inducible protein DinB